MVFALLAAPGSGLPLAGQNAVGEPPLRSTGGSATGALRGSVLDAATDGLIEQALVSLQQVHGAVEGRGHAAAANEVARALTDARGRYAFDHVEPGRYRLRVERLGYRTAELWVEVPARWRVDRSVGLELEPVTLAPVDVRVRAASSPWAPTAARLRPYPDGLDPDPEPGIDARRVVDAHSLDPRALPGTGTFGESDVFRALQRLPGVSSRGDFAATIWARGAPWGLAPVLLDGLPLFDPLHLGGLAAGITTESLERVALYPGVQPPSRAVGAAGLVELTSATARPGPRSSASVSPLAVSIRTEDRWAAGRVGLAAGARRSWWDLARGLLTSLGSDGPIDYHFADVSARGDWQVDGHTRLDWGLHAEEDRLDGGVRDIVATSQGQWGNRTAWIGLRRALGPTRLGLRWGRVEHETWTRPRPWYHFVRISGTPVLDHSDIRLGQHTLSARLERAPSDGPWTFSLGYDWTRQALRQFSLEARDRALPGTSGEATLERGMAWLESSWVLGDLHLAGGVAVDLHLRPALDLTPVRPSLRASWSPTPRVVLEAATGTSRQFVYPFTPGVSLGPALTSGHLWVLAGRLDDALTSRMQSLAAEVDVLPGLTARAAIWRRTVDGFRLTGVAGLSEGRPWPASVSGRGAGVERGRGYELGLVWRDARFQASAHLSRVRSTFEGEEVEPWTSPAERPHAVDVSLGAQVGHTFDVGLDVLWESGWPLVRAPGSACPDEPGPCVAPPADTETDSDHRYGRAPAYVSVDLRARWRYTTGSVDWQVDGAVRNLLGHENPAAYRAGTCQGAELISAVCEQPLGLGRFSPGLSGPTPTIAVRIAF